MIGITIEHRQIVDWTRTRGGHPSIKRPSRESAQPVICFANDAEEVSWDEWLSEFEHGEWVFLYQDRTPGGDLSRSCRILPRFAREQKWCPEIEGAQPACAGASPQPDA